MSVAKKIVARALTRVAVRAAPRVAAARTLTTAARAAAVAAAKPSTVAAKKAVAAAAAAKPQPVRAMAGAAAPPPEEQAMFNPKWVYRGHVFPQLKGLFDAKTFEAANGVTWHQWGPFADIDICWVYNTNSGFNSQNAGAPCGNSGPSAALMRFKPNSKVPAHWHTGCEHILYLQGLQTDERGVFKAGDFVVNPGGTDHWNAVTGPEGCIVLTIWEKSALPLIPSPAPKNN